MKSKNCQFDFNNNKNDLHNTRKKHFNVNWSAQIDDYSRD